MKLKQIIVTLFVILSVLPLLFLGVINLRYTNQKLDDILENDLQMAATIEVKAIDNFYEERAADSNVLANSGMVHDLLTTTDVGRKARLRHDINDQLQLRIGHNRFVESFTVLDRDFVVAACSQPDAIGDISTLRDTDPAYLSPRVCFTPVVERPPEGSGRRVIAAVQEVYDGGLWGMWRRS